MKNLYKGLLSPLLVYFAIGWIYHNYPIVLYYFDRTMTTDLKIEMIKSITNLENMVFKPTMYAALIVSIIKTLGLLEKIFTNNTINILVSYFKIKIEKLTKERVNNSAAQIILDLRSTRIKIEKLNIEVAEYKEVKTDLEQKTIEHSEALKKEKHKSLQLQRKILNEHIYNQLELATLREDIKRLKRNIAKSNQIKALHGIPPDPI